MAGLRSAARTTPSEAKPERRRWLELFNRAAPVTLGALVFAMLGAMAMLLGTENGERMGAGFYGRHLVSAQGECPARFGRTFWFSCEAERRKVNIASVR
jgi:hypothetical protein